MRGQRRAFKQGRKDRLHNELACFDGRQTPHSPSLYSHNATWQSAYEQGWYSVTEWDIYHATHQDGRHGLERAKSLFRKST
ncbi:hypothetical protein DR996_02570 [Vibrio owensii]|uniref:hypothetical protein n=1 Tax=Vibrio jasicida TaxID=766224 RepID=UPI000CE333D9|nr:hypothetical protein [Vibrio jasicida]QLK44281.1 hypothetical protein DR996_02570 [Vibrio owensii]